MEKKVIIRGEVIRFAKTETSVEFSLRVMETEFQGHTFTLGTVISLKVTPKENNDIIILHGGHTTETSRPGEPFKTAASLALKDKVAVEMGKETGGHWEVRSIVQAADRGQDVNEYLFALEERIEEYKVKYPQMFF